MQRVSYQILLYPPHENRNIESRARQIHQKISGKVENLKRTIDGTNKETCPKGLTSAKINPIFGHINYNEGNLFGTRPFSSPKCNALR